MTVPKWLIPVLAVVAAVAVGVAAALVGIQFAPQPAAVPQIVTETVPVVVPMPSPGEEDADSDDLLVSPAVGFEEVVVPTGDELERDPRLLDQIRRLSEADDPGAGEWVFEEYGADAPAGSSETDDSGDPCAPRDGAVPEGCPDGLRSTVLALTAPEQPFYVIPTVSPPTYDELPGPIRFVYCDPAEPGAAELPIGIGTNAPAEITLRFWPTGAPDEVRELAFATSDAARDAWYAGLEADGTFSERWARPQHCGLIPELEPYVSYQSEVTATDDLGRTARHNWSFMLPDDRTVPPVRVLPVTDNVLFVSAPHVALHEADIRAWQVEDGTADACATPGRELPEFAEFVEHEVSADYNLRHGYQPEYTERTSGSFSVPEGSTIAVCIRWFDESRPSWDWDNALRQYQQIVLSPDRLVPTVTLTGVGLARTMAANSIRIDGATREGSWCGSWFGPATQSNEAALSDPPPIVCDLGAIFDEGWASTDGDLVIRSRVRVGDEVTTGGMMLPLSRLACRGVCSTPPASEYRMLLPTIDVPAGVCGSAFGPCDPPTREQAAGTAVLTVAWSQGNRNGQADWMLGSPAEGTPDRVVADFPQFDTRAQLEERDLAGGAIAAGFPLRVDRAVEYTARLIGSCELPATVREVSGTIDAAAGGTVPISFGQVCHHADYAAEVELRDAAGGVWTWGPSVPGPTFWPSYLITSSHVIDVGAVYSVNGVVTGGGLSNPVAYLSPLRITVGSTDVVDPETPRCVNDFGISDRYGVEEIAVGDLVPVHVRVQALVAHGATSGADARCTSVDFGGSGPTVDFTVMVDYERLVSGTQVVIRSPEGSPFEVEVRLLGVA